MSFTKLVIMGAIIQKMLDERAITQRHMLLYGEVRTLTHEHCEGLCALMKTSVNHFRWV